MHCNVHNCCTHYCTEQTWYFLFLPSRQSPLLRWCLFEKRGTQVTPSSRPPPTLTHWDLVTQVTSPPTLTSRDQVTHVHVTSPSPRPPPTLRTNGTGSLLVTQPTVSRHWPIQLILSWSTARLRESLTTSHTMSNSMELVQWLLVGGSLHLVQWGWPPTMAHPCQPAKQESINLTTVPMLVQWITVNWNTEIFYFIEADWHPGLFLPGIISNLYAFFRYSSGWDKCSRGTICSNEFIRYHGAMQLLCIKLGESQNTSMMRHTHD